MKALARSATVAGLVLGAFVLWAFVRAALQQRARTEYFQTRTADAPARVETLGALSDTLRETSGLAVSRSAEGVLYTHNDSGDRPRFYAIDLAGESLATFDVSGATALDWEDVDLGPCPERPARYCLYLADIGDNGRRREVLTVWIVEEPEPATASAVLAPVGRLRYRYPDEPQDAEALAVSPGGDLIVVTKGRTPTILLHRLSAAAVRAALAADTVVTLPAGRVLPITPDVRLGRHVTGASFDPGGAVLAVRTYSEIFFIRDALTDAPVVESPSCWLGDLEQQGEAVAFEDAGTLLLTSESRGGEPARLTRVRCRAPIARE